MDNKNLPIQERFLQEQNQASEIAKFYGFQHFNPPEIKKVDFDGTKNYNQEFYPEEISALLRVYFEEKGLGLPQPLMIFAERPFRGGRHKKRPLRLEASLAIMGSSKPVTDCLSLLACLSILESLGYKELEIKLNAVGDKDSSSDFERKNQAFIKKNYNAFPADLRQALKKDHFVLLHQENSAWQNFYQECPKSIDFLSETSRLHFKEILEFMELLELNYAIDHRMIGDPHLCSETLFVISSDKSSEPLAFGTRVNRLSKKLGHKKDVPIIIFNLNAKLKKALHQVKTKNQSPEFYLIQFGPEAKLKSLLVIEEIRKAGKTLSHSVAKDKLGSQIGVAENSGAKYIILLGQKEALENSVVLRNNTTRAQEIIPIPELGPRLKRL